MFTPSALLHRCRRCCTSDSEVDEVIEPLTRKQTLQQSGNKCLVSTVLSESDKTL